MNIFRSVAAVALLAASSAVSATMLVDVTMDNLWSDFDSTTNGGADLRVQGDVAGFSLDGGTTFTAFASGDYFFQLFINDFAGVDPIGDFSISSNPADFTLSLGGSEGFGGSVASGTGPAAPSNGADYEFTGTVLKNVNLLGAEFGVNTQILLKLDIGTFVDNSGDGAASQSMYTGGTADLFAVNAAVPAPMPVVLMALGLLLFASRQVRAKV